VNLKDYLVAKERCDLIDRRLQVAGMRLPAITPFFKARSCQRDIYSISRALLLSALLKRQTNHNIN